MDSIEQLTQQAQQQNFDSKFVAIFEGVYLDAGVDNIKNMSITQSDRILSILAQEQATPEFIRGFLAYTWQQGIGVDVVQHILNSDRDGDGRTLAQELFTDGSDPFEPDAPSEPIPYRRQRGQDLEL